MIRWIIYNDKCVHVMKWYCEMSEIWRACKSQPYTSRSMEAYSQTCYIESDGIYGPHVQYTWLLVRQLSSGKLNSASHLYYNYAVNLNYERIIRLVIDCLSFIDNPIIHRIVVYSSWNQCCQQDLFSRPRPRPCCQDQDQDPRLWYQDQDQDQDFLLKTKTKTKTNTLSSRPWPRPFHRKKRHLC